MTQHAEDTRATSWLSCDLAELAYDLGLADSAPPAGTIHFDVVIVGSGYGGSVCADELAGYGIGGQPLRIAMLERGKEYVPGAFPSRMSDVAGHVRFSSAGASVRGRPQGLFDVRVGPDVSVVQASGLGGGSLINAGVMARPLPGIFEDPRWPREIRNQPPTDKEFDDERARLRATPGPQFLARHEAMQTLAGSAGSAPAYVTVAQAADDERGIRPCVQCGDCATGCNIGAKLSVDVTLLAGACSKHPRDALRIVTGATVLTIAPDNSSWRVEVVHTDPHLRERQGDPYRIIARHLILSAGTMGSTEVLLRSRSDRFFVSAMLGERFSANGDILTSVYGMAQPTNGAADEADPLDQRFVGPSVTRLIDLRSAPRDGIVLQDLAVPAALRRLFEEVATGAKALALLAQRDGETYEHDPAGQQEDSAGLDSVALKATMAVAIIAHDGADGRLERPQARRHEEGVLGVVWPQVRTDPRLDRAQRQFDALVANNHPGASALRNPAWRPLSPEMEAVWGDARGPVVTVHPLGGCTMGDSAATGVVNHLGQVFAAAQGAVHATLVVLDGSIIPTSLGMNPSLTIATLSRRAIRALRTQWGFARLAVQGDLPPRPRFREPSKPGKTDPTQVALTERMIGTATLATREGARPCVLSLELWFDPIVVSDVIWRTSQRKLTVDAKRSRLRIYRPPNERPVDTSTLKDLDDKATLLLEAPLSGHLWLMRHAPSSPLPRTLRALVAWLVNRGLRDMVQQLVDKVLGRPVEVTAPLGTLARLAWNFASRAGDVRLVEYGLVVGTPAPDDGAIPAGLWEGRALQLVKRVTYECASSPLNQLTQATLTGLPDDKSTVLTVDFPFLRFVGAPLMRIASQVDEPRALADLGSLALYFLRVLAPLHLWTLRLPDRPLPRVAQRLPGAVPGLPEPEVEELAVDLAPDGRPVHLRLTRYRPRVAKAAPPVLMIHGYSASGTTFAHEAIPQGGLVGPLCARGRDAWVLDLRSSAGMPGAQIGWAFEQMGYQDIPLAVEHILNRTGATQVDVVAHCMGSAMLSLGLFGGDGDDLDRYSELRKLLPERIRRVVLSQVGPAVVVAPANTARGYIMQWLRHYLDLGTFELTPPATPHAGQDMLDRVLSIVPYPKEDFARENPLWPPWRRTRWVGTRHRMDALYGVTFRLGSMNDAVLDRIEDFFGPLHLQTVAQVIAISRFQVVTDRFGDGSAMLPKRINERLKESPVLCLHSTHNGLASVETRAKLAALLDAAKCKWRSIEFRELGHQDSLIGRDAPAVFAIITGFLDAEDKP